MSDMDPCELCSTQAETLSAARDSIHQRCARCGDFKITGTGMAVIRHIPQHDKVKLSGWVRDQNMLGEVPELTSDRIRLVVASPLPGMIERSNRLLTFAIRKQSKLGERFNIRNPAFLAITYSQDDDELYYLTNFLSDEGLISLVAMGGMAEVTPRGYLRYEELQTHQSSSAQGFVAMWFDAEMRDAYLRGFEVGIRQSGYNSMRIDRVEHVGKIDDEIIAQIRRSRFLVADFTGHRGGVYFEAGFALGLNLPVIWTCRRDHVDGLHFDIRQFNCIDWAEPGELADRLQKRIEAVIGSGPHKPLPA